ncbi:helix-turn-helix domain-containing protein [Streptomyces sp. NPDC058107]|uniref:helix-turn-helix domain-containing protein n=1 Tax=Streptomyces sp. NPDC058107 TaxID=3346343 RepID=UPI0036F1250D
MTYFACVWTLQGRPAEPRSGWSTFTGPSRRHGEHTDRTNDNGELGDFLRSRRSRLRPEDAGAASSGGVRRVPGLRREKVAHLAGVSTDYYTRLEQGRPPTPPRRYWRRSPAPCAWTTPNAATSSSSPDPGHPDATGAVPPVHHACGSRSTRCWTS